MELRILWERCWNDSPAILLYNQYQINGIVYNRLCWFLDNFKTLDIAVHLKYKSWKFWEYCNMARIFLYHQTLNSTLLASLETGNRLKSTLQYYWYHKILARSIFFPSDNYHETATHRKSAILNFDLTVLNTTYSPSLV